MVDDRLDRLLAEVQELNRQNSAMLAELADLRRENQSLRQQLVASRGSVHTPYAPLPSSVALALEAPPEAPRVTVPSEADPFVGASPMPSTPTQRMSTDQELVHTPPGDASSSAAKRLCFGPGHPAAHA